MRTEEEAVRAIDSYGDMVKRICFLHLKNDADTEDIFQTVFLKYVLYSGVFENEYHEKSWIAKVTMNCCKDLIKSFYKKNIIPTGYIEDNALGVASMEDEELDRTELSQVLETVLSLPEKYKEVVYLVYIEGYTAVQAAEILHKKENTIYTRLARAKLLLKESLGGEKFGQPHKTRV